MKKIIIFSILLLTSSLALSMSKLEKEDRLTLKSRLANIKVVVERLDTELTPYLRDYYVQKAQLELVEDYEMIETILDKNNLPHPKEKDFSWLYYIEIQSSERLSADKKKLRDRQALFDEAQRIYESSSRQ